MFNISSLNAAQNKRFDFLLKYIFIKLQAQQGIQFIRQS